MSQPEIVAGFLAIDFSISAMSEPEIVAGFLAIAFGTKKGGAPKDAAKYAN